MQIYKYGENLRLNGSYAIAIGFFDGVHLAHRELISTAVKEAKKRGILSAVFTFSQKDESFKPSAKRIYSGADKTELIGSLGADALIIADFSQIRELSCDEFVNDILIDKLCCQLCVVGYNFRFGKGASGSSDTLCQLMNKASKAALVIDEYTLDGMAVSSSVIRDRLSCGDMRGAGELLGSPYFISGRVERGDGRGRTLGFPTVNIPISESFTHIRLGVYASLIRVGSALLPGVTNIGVCPTTGRRELHAETYIFEYDGDLYGEDVKVYPIELLREEKQFSALDELIMQINIDKNKAFEITKTELEKEKWQALGHN